MTDTIGIDLGTSAIKVARFNRDGELLALAAKAYRASDEHQVPFEHAWAAVRSAAREVMNVASDRPAVAGIGLASQTHTFALVDDGERPLTPLYLWTGDWAAQEARELNTRLSAQAICDATGMRRLTGQLLGPKCLHLGRADPTLWRRARKVWQLPDLVCHHLCGVAASDASLWSLTGLYDLERQSWWPAMLTELGLVAEQLPTISSPLRCVGYLTSTAADELGLPAGIPVVAGVLDHLTAAAGVGNVLPGLASISTGTASCVVVTHLQRPLAIDNGVIGRHPTDPSRWYALAWSGLSSTGLNWCARQAGGEHKLPELLDAARTAGDGGWRAVPRDPNNGDAGFTFTHAGTTACDRPPAVQAMRAILDCITAEMARLVGLAACGQRLDRLIVIGGGARSDLWPQLLADHLGVPILRPPCIEAAAAGAARFAAHAARLCESPAVTSAIGWKVFEPAR